MIDIADILIYDAIRRTIFEYGLEGTLEAIDRVYKIDSMCNKRFKKIYFNYFLKKDF